MSSPSDEIRLFLVDDHAVVRQGTRDMLLQTPGLNVIGEAEDHQELVPMLKLRTPDVLLLDINLPEKNGFVLLESLRPQFPGMKIVMFSAHTEAQYIRRAVELGADGYLSKTLSQAALVEAVRQVAAGKGPVYSPDVAERLAQLQTQTQENPLTAREQEILLLVAEGQTNPGMAKQLCLSVKTVDTHVANLMKKLGMNKRTQLIAYAFTQGLVR